MSGLKKARLERGMSRRELSERAGVGQTTIQRWEDEGVSGATVGNLLKVCRALGCTLDDVAESEMKGR